MEDPATTLIVIVLSGYALRLLGAALCGTAGALRKITGTPAPTRRRR